MKILFLSSRLPYHGVPGGYNLVYQQVVRLARRGHQVGLASFCSAEDYGRAQKLRRELFELELVDPPGYRSSPRRIFDYLLKSVPPRHDLACSVHMKRKVGAMVERSRYQVVLAGNSEMGLYVCWNRYLSAVRRVIFCHHGGGVMLRDALTYGRLSSRGWIQSLRGHEFDLYRTCDRLLTLTPEARYRLLNYAPELRVSVVPGGVDVNYFTPAADEPAEPAIIFTGFYSDRPNSDALCWFLSSVWPALRRRHPELRFLIVGPAPPYEATAMSRHDGRIEVTGMVPDIRPYLHRAQIFVCPVRLGYGMRGKILEAMSARLAVVSTVLGVEGLPAQSGNNCLLADDPELMGHAINLLLEDPQLRRKIAENGQVMVRERFSWAQSLARMEDVLKSTLG